MCRPDTQPRYPHIHPQSHIPPDHRSLWWRTYPYELEVIERTASADQKQGQEDEGRIKPSFFFGFLLRFFGCRFLAYTAGTVILADFTVHLHAAGLAFFCTGADCRLCLRFFALGESQQVRLIHLVQKVDRIFSIRRPVNDNVKGIAAFAGNGDKLFILTASRLYIIYQGQIALRVRGTGSGVVSVCGGGVSAGGGSTASPPPA